MPGRAVDVAHVEQAALYADFEQIFVGDARADLVRHAAVHVEHRLVEQHQAVVGIVVGKGVAYLVKRRHHVFRGFGRACLAGGQIAVGARHVEAAQRRQRRGHVAGEAAIADEDAIGVEAWPAGYRHPAAVGPGALELIDKVAKRPPGLDVFQMRNRGFVGLGRLLEHVEAETAEHLVRLDARHVAVVVGQPGEFQIRIGFPGPVAGQPDQADQFLPGQVARSRRVMHCCMSAPISPF